MRLKLGQCQPMKLDSDSRCFNLLGLAVHSALLVSERPWSKLVSLANLLPPEGALCGCWAKPWPYDRGYYLPPL